MHETPLPGGFRVYRAARQYHVVRARLPDDARQKGGGHGRQHTELDLRLSELGPGLGDYEVAEEGQLHASAEALTSNERYQRRSHREKILEQPVKSADHLAGLFLDVLLHACAEAEVLALSLENHDLQRFLLGCLVDADSDFRHGLTVQNVGGR